jgi:NADH dehydrogenase
MRVIVAGGTGFVGKAIVSGLLRDGHEIVLIRRPKSKSKTSLESRIIEVEIDLQEAIVPGKLDGDALINLAGIIREFPSKGITFHSSHYLVTKNLVDYAKAYNISRFLQMSASGVGADGQTRYLQTKHRAECYLRESGLDWTIFRPSIIFGPGGGFVRLLADMIKRSPLVPVIGNGNYSLQLVDIDDVCAGFRKSLNDNRAFEKTFEIGGPDVLTYNQILDILGAAMGKKKVRKLHIPVWALRPPAAIFQGLSSFPVTNDQITMLFSNRIIEDRTYFEFFSIAPSSFQNSLNNIL